jgi:NitT/TauT family transport system substrate-binding protein
VRMPKPRLLALLSLVAVATTACGGAASSSTTDDSASSDTSGPVEMQKVSVGNFGNSTLTMPLTIAQEQGFFEDAGLEVETVVAPSGPALASALIGGTTQIATGVTQGIFPAMAQGQPLRAVGPFGQMDLQLVVPEDSGVKDVADLEGKNIGVTARGAVSETFARTMLEEAGVDPDSVTYVAVGPLPAQIAAFQQGAIDASSFSADATVVAEKQGVELRDLVSTLDGSAGELGEYGMQSFWATTEPYTKEHGDVVDGFCTAMNKAAAWYADDANKDAAVQSIMGVTQLPEAEATEIWELQHKEFVPEIDEERWNSNVDWILGEGGSAKVPFDTFVISDCG